MDTLRELDHSRQGKTLQLTKGVHLVVDGQRFPLRQAVYFDTPDGRMVFAIPREGKTYIGTTDTVYREDIAHPRMNEADRQYVIDAINGMFPTLAITAEDVESSWAGVRPLIHEDGKSPSEISRKDEIWQSESGLITIAGGKLTGYRKMAETVVDRLAAKLQQEKGISFAACSTRHLPISGGEVGGSQAFPEYILAKTAEAVAAGVPQELAAKWAEKYGSNVDRLVSLAKEMLRSQETLAGADVDGLPLEVSVPLRYALEEEMVVKPVDFFIRRTGALLFDISWVRQWKEPVLSYMNRYYGWAPERRRRYADELEQALTEAVVPEK